MEKTTKQLAQEHFESAGEDFKANLDWHHDNGWVIDVPYSFGMGYFFEEDGDIVLHVSYVNGDFLSLLKYCLNMKLDKIEFKRNFSGRTKKYDYNRFISRSERYG